MVKIKRSRQLIKLSLASAIFLASQNFAFAQAVAIARVIYFSGTAVSNATFDLASAVNCTKTIAGTTLTSNCKLGVLRCKVAVLNLSDTRQTINVKPNFALSVPNSASFNHQWSGAVQDPITGNSGALTYTVLGGAGSMTLKGNATTPGLLTPSVPAGSDITLQRDEMYLAEQSISVNYTTTTTLAQDPEYPPPGTGMPILTAAGITPYYPWAKMYGFCSGSVSAIDSDNNRPGFVVASGSMDYFADSYHNPIISYGGFVEVGGSSVNGTSTSWTTGQTTANVIHEDDDAVSMWSWGQGQCHAVTNSTAVVGIRIWNTQHTPPYNYPNENPNLSSTFPQHIGSSSIAINGGSPF